MILIHLLFFTSSLFLLQYKKVKITGDISYTCNVKVMEPKEEVLSVVATIDHIGKTSTVVYNSTQNYKWNSE